MPCSPFDPRAQQRPPIARRSRWLIGLLLAIALLQPAEALAHDKGIYRTKAEADARARQLGCQGAHQTNGLWLPCVDEMTLHEKLRAE